MRAQYLRIYCLLIWTVTVTNVHVLHVFVEAVYHTVFKEYFKKQHRQKFCLCRKWKQTNQNTQQQPPAITFTKMQHFLECRSRLQVCVYRWANWQQVDLHFPNVAKDVWTTDFIPEEVKKKQEQHQSTVSSPFHQFWVRSGFLKMWCGFPGRPELLNRLICVWHSWKSRPMKSNVSRAGTHINRSSCFTKTTTSE